MFVAIFICVLVFAFAFLFILIYVLVCSCIYMCIYIGMLLHVCVYIIYTHMKAALSRLSHSLGSYATQKRHDAEDAVPSRLRLEVLGVTLGRLGPSGRRVQRGGVPEAPGVPTGALGNTIGSIGPSQVIYPPWTPLP